jgi:Bacterial Ig-like domain
VTTRTPVVNATGSAQAGNLTATFSEKVARVSGTTFNLRTATAAVAAAVSYLPSTTAGRATLNPTATMLAGTRYTATLTGGITDLAGNSLTASSWSFTTGPRPTVTRKSPAANALGVNRSADVTATFSENVRFVGTSTFSLRVAASGQAVACAFRYNPTTHVVTRNPMTSLLANTRYTATLSSLIRDFDDNHIATTTWTFTTAR